MIRFIVIDYVNWRVSRVYLRRVFLVYLRTDAHAPTLKWSDVPNLRIAPRPTHTPHTPTAHAGRDAHSHVPSGCMAYVVGLSIRLY